MKKKLRYIIIGVIIILVALFAMKVMVDRKLAHEPPTGPCERTETIRMKAPGESVDAVVLDKQCPFEASVIKSVYLTPEGQPYNESDSVAVLYETEGFEVKWESSTELLIEYSSAKVHSSKMSFPLSGSEFTIHLRER